MQVVLSIVVIAVTAGGLTTITLAASEAWGRGKAVAMIVAIWAVMQLLRLGYEYDDGIDFKQLLLPAPFDWGVKIDRMINFWTTPRIWFRAMYIGTSIAAAIVIVRLTGERR